MGRARKYATASERNKAYRQRKKQQLKVYHRSQTIEWETPQAFFDALHKEFHFTLDVCATPENAKCVQFFSAEHNGLVQDWKGVCWMNPPYGDTLGTWIEKAYISSLYGATVVCLVPARTDTKWWHIFARFAETRFVSGRLTFGGALHPAPFPNALLIFRPTTTMA